MSAVLYVVGRLVYLALGAVWLLMIVRAVADLLPLDDDSPIYPFLEAVTEPVVVPFRALLSLFTDVETAPVDVGFFLAFLVLGLLLRLVTL